MAALVAWWQGLTDDNKSAWNAAPNPGNGSGFNLFCSINLDRKNRGQIFEGTPDGSGAARHGVLSALAIDNDAHTIIVTPTFSTNPFTTDLTVFTLSDDGGANTTADSLTQIIGGYNGTNSPASPDIDCKHIAPGTYYVGGAVIGAAGTIGTWIHSGATITIT